MSKRTLSEKHQLIKAKAEYKLTTRLNPLFANEQREIFAGYFITALMERTPRWGSIKIDMPKNF